MSTRKRNPQPIYAWGLSYKGQLLFKMYPQLLDAQVAQEMIDIKRVRVVRIKISWVPESK